MTKGASERASEEGPRPTERWPSGETDRARAGERGEGWLGPGVGVGIGIGRDAALAEWFVEFRVAFAQDDTCARNLHGKTTSPHFTR